MDLFPDWEEIALKVQLALALVFALFAATLYVAIFKTSLSWSQRLKKSLFAASLIVMAGLLFVSMLVYDWAAVLP